ncbi:armadillo-type protein [Nemania sp. FL0916]|nr:armadillo-type protein [Nemania sp. FL0916]
MRSPRQPISHINGRYAEITQTRFRAFESGEVDQSYQESSYSERFDSSFALVYYQNCSQWRTRRDRTEQRSLTERQGLRQIYPERTDASSEFDIIAIHGLDTTSDSTWTWRDQNDKNYEMDWLRSPSMLRAEFPTARIFTYDWPARLFKSKGTTERTTTELARLLLQDIRDRDSANRWGEERRIVFIASCLGGLILIDALNTAAQSHDNCYKSVWNATGGIIFLATPFRGTSFNDIARMADPLLITGATLTATVVTELLSNVRGSTSFLQDLVSKFTDIYHHHGQRCRLQLVDGDSARLHIVAHPIALDRTHVQMNKFRSPECPDYSRVVGEISNIRSNFRQDVDTELFSSYTVEKLRIERLSGESLPMDQCYINLAIVERSDKGGNDLSVINTQQQQSNTSFLAQLRVEEPEDGLRVSLWDLFAKRRGPDGREMQPRRILIRGRAGVGKTTLCKKIVHDFKNGVLWRGLFDRVLWIPLRNLKLKERETAGYNYLDLFHHEYFPYHRESDTLAMELLQRVKTADGRTLFLIDGLDEVSRGWRSEPNSAISLFIEELLNQNDAIITSRPYAALHPMGRSVDLELETIGFLPDQVQDYLRMSFHDNDGDAKLARIQGFLEQRPLLGGLFKIPVQLDALCYTWKDVFEKRSPETMTAVYQGVEEKLWRKDVCNLSKTITPGAANLLNQKQMEKKLIRNELRILEVLAFAGLCSEIVNYQPIHLDAISELKEADDLFAETGRGLYETFASVSFIRTPDSTVPRADQTFHFMHLTYQEYFAARYFVHQWEAEGLLECGIFDDQNNGHCEPAAFIRKHKYNPHYDIMWRFVAGLLASKAKPDEKLNCFFRTIIQEPHDLLGCIHHRVIMRCLHEVVEDGEPETFTSLRTKLEGQLLRWLPLKDTFAMDTEFTTEPEFPHRVTINILETVCESENDLAKIIHAISSAPYIHPEILKFILPWLGVRSPRIQIAVLEVLKSADKILLGSHISSIKELLVNETGIVRYGAVQCFRSWPNMPDWAVRLIADRLHDTLHEVREAAAQVLGSQETLKDYTIHSLAAIVQGDTINKKTGGAVLVSLAQRLDMPDLPGEIIESIVSRVENDATWRFVDCAVYILLSQSHLTEQATGRISDLFSNHQRWNYRHFWSESMSKRPGVCDRIILRVTHYIRDKREAVRIRALECLEGLTELPARTTRIIADVVEGDPSHTARKKAAGVLGIQLYLPDQIMQLVTRWLEGEGENLVFGILSLRCQPSLSTQLIQSIANRLEDDDERVRRAAVQTLQMQKTLPCSILQLINNCLDDNDISVREAALEALGELQDLPGDGVHLVEDLILLYGCKYPRWIMIEALRKPQELPRRVNPSLIGLLDDDDGDMRQKAIELLGRYQDLPEMILELIIHRLEDSNEDTRKVAIIALENQHCIPEKVHQLILNLIDDGSDDVSRAAMEFLEKQNNLPDHVIDSIANRLSSNANPCSRRSYEYLRILGCQSSLPEHVIQLIAGKLGGLGGLGGYEAVEILIPLCNKIPRRFIKSFHRRLFESSSFFDTCWILDGTTSYIIYDGRKFFLSRFILAEEGIGSSSSHREET